MDAMMPPSLSLTQRHFREPMLGRARASRPSARCYGGGVNSAAPSIALVLALCGLTAWPADAQEPRQPSTPEAKKAPSNGAAGDQSATVAAVQSCLLRL